MIIQNIKKIFTDYYQKIPKKFLIVGIINTVFGYFFGIISYSLFYSKFGIFFVAIINNVVLISFAFIGFKFFVFNTKKNNWVLEYLKSYLVYGVKFICDFVLLYFCIEIINFSIYLSQGLVMLATIFLTYKGHKSFTFKIKS